MAALLGLVSLLAIVSATQACMCMPEHPQSHFCSADFVIRARVINSTTRERDYFSPQVYNLKIEKIYKGQNAIKNAKNGVDSDEARLITPPTGISCAVHLEAEEEYLLTGVINRQKQLYTGFCHWRKAWHRLTHSQRAGVRRSYGANCHCKLGSYCYGADCEKKLPGCNETGWSSMAYTRDLCRRMYTFCKAASDSKCEWVETPQYTRCRDDMP